MINWNGFRILGVLSTSRSIGIFRVIGSEKLNIHEFFNMSALEEIFI